MLLLWYIPLALLRLMSASAVSITFDILGMNARKATIAC
jgi:hypothetical protein